MRLGAKQELFAALLPELLIRARNLGYGVRMQELARTAYQAKENVRRGVGVSPSIHEYKLGIDIVLSRDGKILRAQYHYVTLGQFWESLHPDCRWGGRFKSKDGGHFSLTMWGRA